ncbi:uncharacterized protein LOC114355063 [Ostrinia furnacalis]|uniref:uncharacterized protein LOC114355063 n=1 Tax=Ostrinia furnacalis TaxID=93504 RepID=UPI00103B2920|nr:uncharacterized protein LOC114355063 [Ostrinia furnacalis]
MSSTHILTDRILALLGDGSRSDFEDLYDEEDLGADSLVFADVLTTANISEHTEIEIEIEPAQSLSTNTTIPRALHLKPDDLPAFRKNPVRAPIDYLSEYFDENFYEEIARCTNLYYKRKTGQELNTTKFEIAKLFGAHIIMGCLPYPHLTMYWRANMKIGLIADTISRDRFLTLRKSLNVVDHDRPSGTEKQNPLWKVQPVIKLVQEACSRLERVPTNYCIGEHIIPFSSRYSTRHIPRPVGIKTFVLTTSDGLLLDFDIFRTAKTKSAQNSLERGSSLILNLIKSVPSGSSVFYNQRYSTEQVVEEFNCRNIHSKDLLNPIPDRATNKLEQIADTVDGECQASRNESNDESAIMPSKHTESSTSKIVKRSVKNQKHNDDEDASIAQQYFQHTVGVDILNRLTNFYNANNRGKWTLNVIFHFFNLALVNSWRLYRNDCVANGVLRKDTLPLLDFRFSVADSLTNAPERDRPNDDSESDDDLHCTSRRYRPIRPSERKRYDGYDHLAVFDELRAPRSCYTTTYSKNGKILIHLGGFTFFKKRTIGVKETWACSTHHTKGLSYTTRISKNGNVIINYEGFSYFKKRKFKSTDLWACSTHHTKGCKAKLTVINGHIVKKKNEHLHE